MSEDILLRSNPFQIVEISKPTKAQFWKDRKPGDIVIFEYSLEDPGRGRTLYASSITVRCGEEYTQDTPSNLANRIKSFIFFELHPQTFLTTGDTSGIMLEVE